MLVWICKTRMILPKSYTLPGTLLITSSHPLPSGALDDIHTGTLDGFEVCVKQPRTYSTNPIGDMPRVHMVRRPLFPVLKGISTSFQEAVMWKHAKHPNIVPFLGVTNTPLQLVSNWMPGGNVMEYIKGHPGADRLALVRYSLLRDPDPLPPYQLLDVAEALHYLHSRNVVHGDLKGVCELRKKPSNLLTKVLAKHSRRRCRTCMSHGLWACHRHSGPGTHRVHSRLLFHTMDRTGDRAWGSWHQQGNRHILIRDGHDRGTSPRHRSRQLRHYLIQGHQRVCSVRQ